MFKSKYFTDRELCCRCGCGARPTEDTIMLADHIREAWGAPLSCTSGARCAAYTEKLRAQGIPAARKSAHLEGLAIDLTPVNRKYEEFHNLCTKSLEEWDCWMEDPAATPSWAHIQLRPSAKRIFKP